MPPTVIANPVINSAFVEPTPHFRFTNDGISDEITETSKRIFHAGPST